MEQKKDDINIESGIPAPTIRRRYPWRRMEIGQSIFVPGIKEGATALGAAYQFAKRAIITEWNSDRWVIVGQKRFIGRLEGMGWRIWRVADVEVPAEYIEEVVVDGKRVQVYRGASPAPKVT